MLHFAQLPREIVLPVACLDASSKANTLELERNRRAQCSPFVQIAAIARSQTLFSCTLLLEQSLSLLDSGASGTRCPHSTSGMSTRKASKFWGLFTGLASPGQVQTQPASGRRSSGRRYTGAGQRTRLPKYLYPRRNLCGGSLLEMQIWYAHC